MGRLMFHFRNRAQRLTFLLEARVSRRLLFSFLRHKLRRGPVDDHVVAEYAPHDARLERSADWFSGNLPRWSAVLGRRFDRDAPLSYLEIGAFEGLSANFIAWAFPKASVTCVDVWVTPSEEILFDRNTAWFRDRLDKQKTTSARYLAEAQDAGAAFDLIYVDGDHHADAVLADGMMAFRLLREGGILVFDDFLWRGFDHAQDNPCAAISAFVGLKAEDVDVLHVGNQVFLQKRRSRAYVLQAPSQRQTWQQCGTSSEDRSVSVSNA